MIEHQCETMAQKWIPDNALRTAMVDEFETFKNTLLLRL